MVNEKKPLGNFQTLLLKFDAKCSEEHQLFIKEHSVRNQEPEYPRGKTLFVLNVPPYATQASLKSVFTKKCGHVKEVRFGPSSGASELSFKAAYIIFVKESGLDKALSLPKDFTLVLHENEDKKIKIGMSKWITEYNNEMQLDEKKLMETIDEFMSKYDKKIEAKQIVDEENADPEENDGWTTVSSQKKRGKFAPQRKESMITKITTNEERKNKKKELVNFYPFQKRQKQMEKLAEFRKNCELDKIKLEKLKAKRVYKPFG